MAPIGAAGAAAVAVAGAGAGAGAGRGPGRPAWQRTPAAFQQATPRCAARPGSDRRRPRSGSRPSVRRVRSFAREGHRSAASTAPWSGRAQGLRHHVPARSGSRPAIDGVPTPGDGHSYRTSVRRSAAVDIAWAPARRRSAGPPRAGSGPTRDERVLGEGGRVAADRVVRNGQSHLVRRGWPSTKQFDEGGPGHQTEDETQSQETEFARCHAATILKLVLLRLWGTTARGQRSCEGEWRQLGSGRPSGSRSDTHRRRGPHRA